MQPIQNPLSFVTQTLDTWQYKEDQLPDSQLRAAEIGNWGRGQFGNQEEGERPPLQAATKQRSEDCDWEH
jgi:hypothetical protein